MTQNKYRFIWNDGKENTGTGETPEQAFTNLGYGAGAIRALDYYEKVKDEDNDTE